MLLLKHLRNKSNIMQGMCQYKNETAWQPFVVRVQVLKPLNALVPGLVSRNVKIFAVSLQFRPDIIPFDTLARCEEIANLEPSTDFLNVNNQHEFDQWCEVCYSECRSRQN